MTSFRDFRIVTSALIATLMVGLTTGGALMTAGAATPAQTVIPVRQASYKKMGTAMKALSDQLKTSAPAKDVMLNSARTIAMIARDQPKLFPAGSGPESGVKTDALPVIWTDRAKFDAAGNTLITESTRLVAVVNGGDITAIRAQTKATGAACGACHRQFRADT